MKKPNIIRGICEFCGIQAAECIHHSMGDKSSDFIDRSTLSPEPIPKIIYSTWISDKPLPEKFLKYIESWQRVMPDYRIEIISMKNKPESDFINRCIERKMFVVAGHYARVQRIYETGGIYFDIDVETVKPFDRFLNESMFVGFEDVGLINNAVFGARKGHPFLKMQLDFLDSFDLGSPSVELETGIRAFAKMSNAYDWKELLTYYGQQYFYPYKYFEEFTPECVTDDTYAIHHWAGSWIDGVSIIIPCYKQEEYLDDAIKSAVNQTIKPWEVIVVNDGSPTFSMWKNIWPENLVKVVNKENGGLPSARNAGIKAAKGKYIIPLDSDDILRPEFIEKTLPEIKNGFDIISTQLETFGDDNRVWDIAKKNPTFEDFYENNQINCCALYTKEMWEKIGGYDETQIMCDAYEDWDFWTRATHAGYKVTVVEEPLFLYRKHGFTGVARAKQFDAEARAYMRKKYEPKTTTKKATQRKS